MHGHGSFTRILASLLFFVLMFATVAQAGPGDHRQKMKPRAGGSPWIDVPVAAHQKAATDTFYLLGGPHRLDGSFENAAGGPDWHGWTHLDLTLPVANRWHVSTYWAYGLNGHGVGNQALVCVDETISACSETDTIGGVAASMLDNVVWEQPVADPASSTVVRLTGHMHYDLVDAGWDFLELFVFREGTMEMLDTWTGSGDNAYLDYTFTVEPADYQDGHVRLMFRVWSDPVWDDHDCLSPSHGACQLDDLSVYFDDALVTFDDFEPGSVVNWDPGASMGVGDFAALRNRLGDLDPCNNNFSYQVSFIDDGEVVPGTGGTMCEEFCYGPGGYVVNHDGGLLAGDPSQEWFLHNQIRSPAIELMPGLEGAQLEFDVYRHELLSSTSPGIFFYWSVRSTASEDPADLERAPWRNSTFLFFGTPDYVRFQEPVGDLLEEDARWAQIALDVDESGWTWGFNGSNGTPAPYFDNVAFKVWAAQGPQILVDELDLLHDAFPEQGFVDRSDPASNWCRVDSAVDLDGSWDSGMAVGDSLVARVTPLRGGAELVEPPVLHYVMQCNPVFDGVRGGQPGPDGLLRGTVPAAAAFNSQGQPYADRFSFDLPDTGFFFPGDRLRYYITASDEVGGMTLSTAWPADTTGVLDFSRDSGFPAIAEIRALPRVTCLEDEMLCQPTMLLVDEAGDASGSAAGSLGRWERALAEHGFVRGADYDLLQALQVESNWSAGMGPAVTAGNLDGYRTILFSSGSSMRHSLDGSFSTLPDQVISQWLDQGDRNLLLAGDNLFTAVYLEGSALAPRLLVNWLDNNIADVTGGVHHYQVNPVAGNGVINEDDLWYVNAECPEFRLVDAYQQHTGAVALATLEQVGQAPVGTYTAAVGIPEPGLDNRIIMVPFDIAAVTGVPGHPNSHAGLTPRGGFLRQLLDWFEVTGGSPTSGVPESVVSRAQAAPNPFNPQTVISFELPRDSRVKLAIHDLKGRLVRRLAEERLTAGRQEIPWNGRDAQGRAASSGIYFYRLEVERQVQLGKVTLLK